MTCHRGTCGTALLNFNLTYLNIILSDQLKDYNVELMFTSSKNK